MLRIKTAKKPSKIHGTGLFAAQFVPKGTITWQYDPVSDSSFSKEEFEKLSEGEKNRILKHGYFDYELDKYILCNDDQRFINHSSKNFNIASKPDRDVASLDISEGEELLCNYNHYENNWFENRNLKESDFVDFHVS